MDFFFQSLRVKPEKIENEQVVTFSNASVFQWPPCTWILYLFYICFYERPL